MPAAPSRTSSICWAVAVLLLCLHWWLALSAIRTKSLAIDEIGHLTSGYTYLKFGDFRLDPQNGLLPQMWAALPLVCSNVTFPTREQPAWWRSSHDSLGFQFLYGSGNDPVSMLNKSRAMMALFSVALGLLIFLWSKSLFGPKGGLLSLTLYSFFPAVLGVGPLVISDMAATFFFAAAVWAFWRSLHNTGPLALCLSALAVTGLFLSKMSAPLFLPMAAVMLGVRLYRKEARQKLFVIARSLAAQAVIIYVLIWAAYGFRFSAFTNSQPDRDTFQEAWDYISQGAPDPVLIARDLHLFPEAYLYGFCFVFKHSKSLPESPRPSFLNGEYSLNGFLTYFPYCVLYKTPIGILLVLGLAAVALTMAPSLSLYEATPLLSLFIVYWLAALHTALNIGNRHILPTYPPMFVIAGAAAVFIGRRQLAPAALLAVGVAATLAESFYIRPDYQAFFNLFAGGPGNGYKHMVDGSLDSGQDLTGVKHWIDSHPEAGPIYLSYFGAASTKFYGIRAIRLPSASQLEPREQGLVELKGGAYLLSATNLQSIAPPVIGHWAKPYEQAYQQLLRDLRAIPNGEDPSLVQKRGIFELLQFNRLCAFLRQRKPDDEIGHTILVYHLSDDDIHQALLGAPAELEPKIAVEGLNQ